MTSSHTPAADRSKGGPGSSHETAEKPGTKVTGAHHHNQAAPKTPGEAKAGDVEHDKKDHGHAGSRGRQ